MMDLQWGESLSIYVDGEGEDAAVIQELDDRRFAVVSDTDGRVPERADEALYWSLYIVDEATGEGAFQWSVTLRDVAEWQALAGAEPADAEHIIERMAHRREENIARFEEEG